jgi:uncharacterized protein YbaR (Trm112 family)
MEKPNVKRNCPVCNSPLELGNEDELRCYCWSCNHWVFLDCLNCHGKAHTLFYSDGSLYCETCNHDWVYELDAPSISDLPHGSLLNKVQRVSGVVWFLSFWAGVLLQIKWIWVLFGIISLICLAFLIAEDVLKTGGLKKWQKKYFQLGLRGALQSLFIFLVFVLIVLGIYQLLTYFHFTKDLLVGLDNETGRIVDFRFQISIIGGLFIMWQLFKLRHRPPV